MVINLITFASILHKQASVRSSHVVILTELEKYFTVNFIDYKDIDKLSPDDFSIIFIATGGVERLVIQHFESLPRPAILLADGMQNSRAALRPAGSLPAMWIICLPNAAGVSSTQTSHWTAFMNTTDR